MQIGKLIGTRKVPLTADEVLRTLADAYKEDFLVQDLYYHASARQLIPDRRLLAHHSIVRGRTQGYG